MTAMPDNVTDAKVEEMKAKAEMLARRAKDLTEKVSPDQP